MDGQLHETARKAMQIAMPTAWVAEVTAVSIGAATLHEVTAHGPLVHTFGSRVSSLWSYTDHV